MHYQSHHNPPSQRSSLRSAVRSTVLTGLLLGAITSESQAQTVLDLAFVMDGSGSIDAADFALQKEGLVAAIGNPQLVPRDGSIGLTIVQYGGGATSVEVPYRVINTEADANTVANQIASFPQIGGGTNPGDGILTAIGVLDSNGNPAGVQSICLSTDGTPNTGVSLASAVSQAQSSLLGLDVLGVIGIECPGLFGESQLQSSYGPFVFGGGGAVLVFGSTEFANTVGPACFGQPARLVGLEVIQSVQDWNNSVPLIAGKTTYVRAHLEPLDPLVPTAISSVRLRGFGPSGEFAESPLAALNLGGLLQIEQDALARRGDFNASMNYRLPSNWTTSGTIQLRLEAVGPELDCSQSPVVNNDCELDITFNSQETPEIEWVSVTWTDGTSTFTPSTNDINNLANRFRGNAPVAAVSNQYSTLTYSGPLVNSRPDLQALNSQLLTKRALDFCWTWLGCDRRYYGALRGPDTGGLAAGIGGAVSSGTIQDSGYGRHRHTHELAHSLSIRHAPFCGASDANAPTFPYSATVTDSFGNPLTVAALGPMDMTENDQIYGFDVLNLEVVDPNETFELMSYCGSSQFFSPSRSRWPSKFTYENLRNAINTTFFQIPNSGPLEDHLFVRGSVELATGSVTWEPFYTDEIPTGFTTTPGDYRLEVRDVMGVRLDTADFELTVMEQDIPSDGSPPQEGTMGVFLIPFNQMSTIAEVGLLENGVEVATLTASPSAPAVEVTFPNGGELFDLGTATFAWDSSDADGDDLAYAVQFSPDGGSSWSTLAVDTTEGSLQVDLASLPGTAMGLVRVQASDGVLVTVDESDSFVITDRTPTATIAAPFDGDEFFGVQPIFFEGAALDMEDGELAAGSLVWTSSLDGLLGTGNQFVLAADDLTPGQHVLTLSATDSVGNVGSAVIEFAVDTIFQGDPEVGTPYCEGDDCPCGNTSSEGGCANSLGNGGSLKGEGSADIASDDLVLTSSGLTADSFAVMLISATPSCNYFGDGRLGLFPGPQTPIYRLSVRNSGATGVVEEGPGILGLAQSTLPGFSIASGMTLNFQCIYRDANAPCGTLLNLTNALAVTFQ